jgi:hypothetical protein
MDSVDDILYSDSGQAITTRSHPRFVTVSISEKSWTGGAVLTPAEAKSLAASLLKAAQAVTPGG